MKSISPATIGKSQYAVTTSFIEFLMRDHRKGERPQTFRQALPRNAICCYSSPSF